MFQILDQLAPSKTEYSLAMQESGNIKIIVELKNLLAKTEL